MHRGHVRGLRRHCVRLSDNAQLIDPEIDPHLWEGRFGRELTKARRLGGDAYSSLTRLKATQQFGSAKVRALFEQTYFAGLRKAEMAEN